MPAPEPELSDQIQQHIQQELDEDNDLPMKWEPPQTYQETQLQAEAIQNMLCSSLTPPDTPTCCQNQENAATFACGILATNILHNQLVDYMWDSYLMKAQQDDWNKHGQTQLQKGEVVYSHDVDRNIAGAENCLQMWESLDLSADQKLYRLKFSYSVLPQLILKTKLQKQKADQNAAGNDEHGHQRAAAMQQKDDAYQRNDNHFLDQRMAQRMNRALDQIWSIVNRFDWNARRQTIFQIREFRDRKSVV